MKLDELRAELRQNIIGLEQQRDQAYATYQQTLGALQLAQSVLNKLNSEQDMTVNEFARMIGGNGATAVIEEA